MAFPSGLQSLTFGAAFNQNLEDVTFPSGLQSLTFGADFNQNLEDVTFPKSLTSGAAFDQNLEGVTLSSSLQSLTMLDVCFCLRPEPEGRDLPIRFAKLDVWCCV